MTIIVNSPFTGQPVRIREKDVGRAVKDEDGGIFYVLPKEDGSGYYGAPTRAGGKRAEEKAATQESRMSGAGQVAAQREHLKRTPQRRKGGKGKLIFFLFIIAAAAAAWAVFFGPLKGMLDGVMGSGSGG